MLPTTFRIALVFVLINALLWLVLGAVILLGLQPALEISSGMRTVFGGLVLAAAGMMVLLYRQLRQRNPTAFRVALTLFIAIAAAMILIPSGWTSAILLALTLLPLSLLFISRRWYFETEPLDDGADTQEP